MLFIAYKPDFYGGNMRIIAIAFVLSLFSVSLTADCSSLVDVRKLNNDIAVDLRYATTNNVFQRVFYPSPTIYVDSCVALRLSRIQRELSKQGIGLIVFEGYRPPSIQQALDIMNLSQEYRFDDTEHYRKGLGVDVGLYYLDGQDLEVPSPWGIDCERAYQDFYDLPAMAYHNRTLLTEIMMRHGFVPLRERWWHFDLKGWDNAPNLSYEPVDLENGGTDEKEETEET